MVPPPGPRIVFFGIPNAGKTALLTALLRVARSDEVIPLTPAGEAPRDVVPHIVQTRPARDASAPVVLIDTDGKTAAKLIAEPGRFRSWQPRREPTSVSAAVYGADALVLLIDASANEAELDQLFHNFGKFLDGLEESRTLGREVGGLPVFLTLTKCDVLWRSGDDPEEWLARVEERQQEVGARFEEYLAEERQTGPFAFGSIEVLLAATARRFPNDPQFADRGDEPFGVEELFHDSTTAAQAFRRRVDRSGRRLRWTVTGSAALVGTLAIGLAGLLAYPGYVGTDPLADRVRAYRELAGPPAIRLADRNFARNEAELTTIRQSAGFDRLPEELREFVVAHQHELAVYHAFREQFRPPRLGPADVRSRAELDQLEADLAGDLKPPAEFAVAWAETEAVRLGEKWRTDAHLLRRAEETLYDWYRGLIRRSTGLQLAPTADYRWRHDVDSLVAEAANAPFRRDETIPGSPRVPIRRGATLTFAPVFECDRIAAAQQDWDIERARLLDLRNLADALGLTAGPNTPPAVLDLPEPSADLAQSRALPAERLQALKQAYPSPALDYREWAISRFADPLRSELRRRLGQVFDTGARHVRRLVVAMLGSAAGSETHADWLRVAAMVESDAALKEWGAFLALIRRLAELDGNAGDPVVDLVAFLRRDRFDAEVRSIELLVPDDLRGQRATPVGPFVIRVVSPTRTEKEYRFRSDGEPRRDGPASLARFVADNHTGTMTFHPGDDISASVTYRAGGQDFELVWSNGRSRVYTFDRISSQPEVRRLDGATAGERATGVRLRLLPEKGWPDVPPLLP